MSENLLKVLKRCKLRKNKKTFSTNPTTTGRCGVQLCFPGCSSFEKGWFRFGAQKKTILDRDS